ncbi:MAG: zinc ribbon domain-containing protein [Firmicutes bacterium]|nr:zinc ribbon domain-containing protein [Bacillota bacterium]MBQ4092484.1 zinc ribbon domain-containing protein [Bacillota bacterium]MBQ6811018.1 zinc ribbon domain-containing protein [Bacillota bacterium]
MAFYKQPCIHCGTMIEGDARYCTGCGSMSPFGYHCPTCNRPIEKGQRLCDGCGRPLYVNCPMCGKPTFVQERCEQCGTSLMIRCANRRCGEPQFFQNTKCTACGKKIKEEKGGNRIADILHKKLRR